MGLFWRLTSGRSSLNAGGVSIGNSLITYTNNNWQ